MGVKPKDINFSAFDSAVKNPPSKNGNGKELDFSAFDNTVKKKDGGTPSEDGSQTGQSPSISPSNSFLRSDQTAQPLQSNFKDQQPVTTEPSKDWSGIEASLQNARDKYDQVQSAKSQSYQAGVTPGGGYVPVNQNLVNAMTSKSITDYDEAQKSKDDILKANATEIIKPVKDLIDNGGYKNFFDAAGNFKVGEATDYIDKIVKQNKGGQYLRDQLVVALKQAGQFQLDEPVREKFRAEEYKKAGIDISKFGQDVFNKATAVQRSNIDLLAADTKIKGDQFLNTAVKPEATKVGVDYAAKVKDLQDQVQSGQILPEVAQQQLQQANIDYHEKLANLNKEYQEGVRAINIKAQDKFARIDKEMKSIAAGLTDQDVLKAIPDDILKKKADADARVEARIENQKNETRKVVDEAIGQVTPGGFLTHLLVKSTINGWYSGLANMGQYLAMKGHDNGLTDYLRSKQYDADLSQTGQYKYGDGETLARIVTSTGTSLGASLPITIPAIGVSVATSGLGLPEVAGAIATGFTSYYGEKAQNTGQVYQQMLEQTGDSNKAYEAASRYEEKQKVMMPLYFLEGAGIHNLIQGKGVKQLLIGQAQELAQELPTEYWQNYTQAQETEGYKGGFGKYIKENPETAIDIITSTIGQGAIMSSGGKIFQNINSVIPHAQSQYFMDMVNKHGVDFADQQLQKQFQTGVIDEKGLANGQAIIARAVQKINDLAKVGMKGDDAKAFTVLSDTANDLTENASKTKDEGMKVVYEQKLEQTKSQMEAAANGQHQYAVFKMPGGTDATKVVPIEQIESMRKSGMLDQLIHQSDGVEVVGNETLNKELQNRKNELGNPENAPEGLYTKREIPDAEEKPTEAERPIMDRVKEYGGEGIQRTIKAHEAEGKQTEAMDFLKEQALDTPNSLKKQLGMRKNLTVDIIAENNPTEIDDAIRKWEDKLQTEIGKENSDPKVVKEIDQHISLLEKGLEKANEKSGTQSAPEENINKESSATSQNETQQIEQERESEIDKAHKPSVGLDFVSSKELVNSNDPIGNKEAHDKIKDKFTDLQKLIDCLWG